MSGVLGISFVSTIACIKSLFLSTYEFICGLLDLDILDSGLAMRELLYPGLEFLAYLNTLPSSLTVTFDY